MVIEAHTKNYKVIIHKDYTFFEDLKSVDNSLWIIDRKVFELYRTIVFSELPVDRLFLLDALEENKTMETVLAICDAMTSIPAKRNATIISVGGGIVQDITGFAANILYRGINWIYVPTTLLSACDSCIGGKTSLNYNKFKNLLGTFYPPDVIHICSDFFKTLTDIDFKSGLGEVVKFNIMTGESGLINVEKNLSELLDRKLDVVNRFVSSSLEYKKGFIERDEFDKGERIKLNFAHTFGHAIEVVTKYEIPHGTAVAIGMIMANSLSGCRNMISNNIQKRSEKQLLRIIDINLALLEDRPFEEFMRAIKKDKKQVDDCITAVLITKYGKTAQLSIVHDISGEEIRNAIEYFINLYRRGRCQ